VRWVHGGSCRPRNFCQPDAFRYRRPTSSTASAFTCGPLDRSQLNSVEGLRFSPVGHLLPRIAYAEGDPSPGANCDDLTTMTHVRKCSAPVCSSRPPLLKRQSLAPKLGKSILNPTRDEPAQAMWPHSPRRPKGPASLRNQPPPPTYDARHLRRSKNCIRTRASILAKGHLKPDEVSLALVQGALPGCWEVELRRRFTGATEGCVCRGENVDAPDPGPRGVSSLENMR
jgi:hypothetical protein